MASVDVLPPEASGAATVFSTFTPPPASRSSTATATATATTMPQTHVRSPVVAPVSVQVPAPTIFIGNGPASPTSPMSMASMHSSIHEQQQQQESQNEKQQQQQQPLKNGQKESQAHSQPQHAHPSSLHTHRQNHNSSKLPAFRFADLKDLQVKKDALVLPCRLQHIPPSPVSPDAAQISSDSARLEQPLNGPSAAECAGSSSSAATAATEERRHSVENEKFASTTSAASANPSLPARSRASTFQDSTQQQPQQQKPDHQQQHHQQEQSPPQASPPKTLSSSSSSTGVTASSSTSPSAATSTSSANRTSTANAPTSASASIQIISTSISPPKRPASFPNSPPKVIVSAANTTPTCIVSSGPTPTRLQRTLTDPSPSRSSTSASANIQPSHSHRRPPVSKNSHAVDTSRGPPPALSAKRVQPVIVQAAPSASASVPSEQNSTGASPSTTAAAAAAFTTTASSAPASPSASDGATKESTKGQRELILPKAIRDQQHQYSHSADEKRKTASRPPVSFRPPRTDGSATTSRAVIPPIRSFRSSGSRKSLVLDMNFRSPGAFDDADYVDGGVHDPIHRDRTLRALEGRSDDEMSHITPPDQVGMTSESENTADLFMRIARDDSHHRSSEEERPSDSQSTVSRATRLSRRPFSVAVPSHQTTTPPQVSRRHSDQRETARQRRLGIEAVAQQQPQPLSREVTHRALSKDRPTPIRTSLTQKTDSPRSRVGTVGSGGLKTAPSTPRTSSVFFDTQSDVGTPYGSRRPSIPDNGSTILPARTSSIKASHSYARTYNSSPLVPKHPEPQRQDSSHDTNHGALEGTESSASTAAPSTVWDELDDLKSRMRRLELSGKIPPTAGAAMSRISDDRPATATTSATTISASPKRGSNNAQTEARSTTSSQRQQQLLSLQKETQPSQSILLSALQKAKTHASEEVYRAIETIATEALTLSHMVGVAGQPGPISSGASTIGTGGPATITDRQLRRKAESICRSLTELCLAMNDEAAQAKAAASAAAAVASVTAALQATSPREEPTIVTSPTVISSSKTFSSLASARRTMAESHLAHPANSANPANPANTAHPTHPTHQTPPTHGTHSTHPPHAGHVSHSPQVQTSPRASTRLDGRRTSMFGSPAMPPARHALGPPVSTENPGRKSSLLLARTRRAVPEEPEDTPVSGRRSSLLRVRRAGTEEPDEGRRSSILRTRRTIALADDDDEGRPRPPSRANTELSLTPRAAQRERHGPGHAGTGSTGASQSSPLESSALPRRRLVPSSLNTRLVTPQTTTTAMATSPSLLLSGRRFTHQLTSERESSVSVDKLAEERVPSQRRASLAQSSLLHRSGTRRLTRDTTLPNLSSAASQVGGYR